MILLTFFYFFPLLASNNGVVVDRIVARIENEIILLSDLSQKVELLTGNKVDYNESDPKVAKFYQSILNELIEDRIVQMELKKMGNDVTELELKSTIDDIRKQRGFTEQDFENLLQKEGLTMERYREEMRRQVRKNKFMAIKVRPRVKITDEDALQFYKQEFSSKRLDKTYDISMIFVSVLKDKASEKDSIKRVEEIKKELEEKKEFSEIARRYSDDPSASSGGHIGVITKGDIREEFEKVIFSLKEGENSDAIKLPEGYYIFRLNKIGASEIKGFDESKEDIKKMLFEKEMMKQYSYVMDSLKKRYTIYINLK
ncbi:MAG: foldase protein PrsA [Myxococcota bacterium]